MNDNGFQPIVQSDKRINSSVIIMLIGERMKIPFEISPSVSNLVMHDEETGETYVEFIGWYEKRTKYEIIRFTFQRCVGTRCYSIGGDADYNNSIGKVKNSSWLKELNDLQMREHPESADNFYRDILA